MPGGGSRGDHQPASSGQVLQLVPALVLPGLGGCLVQRIDHRQETTRWAEESASQPLVTVVAEVGAPQTGGERGVHQ